ncbi:hypothetical protein PoB_003292000 [Plakobranchus ocellatus]|uniref:Sulfatase N-terminal domain-containing protein n=1 Tax=Plakobranchus ocellatus TaxID=259542 RepID=A0AAV4AE20_9GAST|nr:hypothetical protein PoB_003292000 [Plakobranchus ocellatus]
MTTTKCPRRRVTVTGLFIVIAVSAVYLFQAVHEHAHSFRTSNGSLRDVPESRKLNDMINKTMTKHVNGKVCVFPQVNPYDSNIMKLAGLDKKTIVCDNDFMAEITYIDGLNIKINNSKINKTLGLSHCKYRNITRLPFKDNSVEFSPWSKEFTEAIKISDEHEFLHVECYAKKDHKSVVSKAFYSLVPKKKHLEKLYDVKIKKRQVEFDPKETLNIIIVALDGLPRHQLLRGMPKTYKHITENLKTFDFTMHSQVADNTFPNFLAILSGSSHSDVRRYWDFSKPEDAFDLIWQDFERAGYRTLYTEDYPKGAGFYWGGRSFINPQTSYWNRPLELAMLEEKGFIRRKSACAGPRPISEYQLEYLIRFLDTFPNKPVACATFIINLTHDDSTQAGYIDEHIFNFYKTLGEKKYLDKSLVMLLSDHGQRWGEIRKTYNGIVESRNPFLFLTFPPWFLKKYPDIARNLETNTLRLTSHFDTRQMLLDLLYFRGREPIPPYRGKHGISLFRELPEDRTCANASIPGNQCLCGQNVDKFMDVNSSNSILLANGLFEAIKKKSDPNKCEKYQLDRVLQVGVLSMPGASNAEKKRFLASRVRLTTKPGGAMFEGTVYLDLKSKETSVGSNIERLNMYKGEVECLPTSREQMYCYCKGNKQSKLKS